MSVCASDIEAGRPTSREIVRSRWYSIAHARRRTSTSRLSVRLSTVPSLYSPSWKAVVRGVEPSAGRRVRSLFGSMPLSSADEMRPTCNGRRAVRQTRHPGYPAAALWHTPVHSGPIRRNGETTPTVRPLIRGRSARKEWQWPANDRQSCTVTSTVRLMLTTMNMSGSHLRVSASIRGDDGLRPSESKKVS